MRKKTLAILFAVLLALAFLPACQTIGGSGAGKTPPQVSDGGSETETGDGDETDPPLGSRWNVAPTVTGEFYDDFGDKGFSSLDWSLVNYSWGGNGVSASNVFISRSRSVADAEGATGGVAVLKSYGNYAAEPAKRRQGACLISNHAYGPGKYEARMKVVPRFGPCSTAWTYYTNSTGGMNTAADIEYHEIDIECPAIGKGFNAWGGVAYEEYYIDSATGKTVNKSNAVTAACDSPYNDGKWHVFGLEWRTDEANGDSAVVWYMDGKEVGSTTRNVPRYSCQLWIGAWFPDNSDDWLGTADFDEAYMYVDWVRITEYADTAVMREPDLGGCLLASAASNLYSAPLPTNDYITNGDFAQGGGNALTAWQGTGASKAAAGGAVLQNGGKLEQVVSAQYNGYTFDLTVGAAAGAGGTLKVYAEYLNYVYPQRSNANAKATERTVVGKSAELIFDSPSASSKTLRFTLESEDTVNNVRIVIEAAGASGTVYKAEMRLAK
ncbi:MAG: family 16 glycosylhydrolase [Clostridiales bacterium]|jgi:predicted small secreted protein|nr:family 16 glycosylhydrolase [Clostridiales bacterium]